MTAALDEDRDLVYHAVLTDPIVQARLTLDEAWRMTDELIAAEAGVAPRMARWHGPGLARLRRRHAAAHHRRRLRRALATGAAITLLVAACGGTTNSTAPASGAAGSAAPASAAAGSEAPSGASAAPSEAGYTGPPATITYSIWGDPQEITSQTAIADAFTAANPDITVNVDVSDWDAYWDKLQTGLAGGAAPDVFAMDGPLFPDYQSRDVLLDLKPLIDRDGYDLTQLADQGVADFTTADGGQYGLPRDLNTIVLYYNKDMFDAAGIPYPDETLGLGQAARGREAADQGRRTATARRTSGASTPRRPTWRTTGCRRCGRTAATSSRPDGKSTVLEHRPGGGRHPVPPGPHLEGQGHARSGDHRRDR